jgi:outer membrane protein
MNKLMGAVALTVMLSSWQTASAVSLVEIYEDAMTADPTLREAAANRMATLESKPQALASLLPQVEGQYNYERRWNSGKTTFTSATTDPATGETVIFTAENPFSQDTKPRKFWQLRLTQTLFRWDQWVALKQADKQVAQAEAEYRAAQQDLMLRVSQRYFDVLDAKATLEAGEAAKEAIGRQLEQAEKRFEVGLIAITDVQEAQASFDSAVAGVIEAKRTLATAAEFLREITGQYYEILADAGPDIPLISPDPNDVEVWVKTALEQNLNVEASRLAAEIARDDVSSTKAGHMPSVDFFASRSNDNQDATRSNKPRDDPATGGRTPEVTGPADSDIWSDAVGVQVNVPIFSGGAVRSQVKEAGFQYRAAQERLERSARETERAVRDSFLSVNAEISRVQALAKSVESNQTALRATEAGFEVGTRTTVDVLDARRNVFEAQRDYARSRYTYVVNALRLKQAAGTLGEDDIREVDGWLAGE